MKQTQESAALSFALRKLAYVDITVTRLKKILITQKFSNEEIENTINYLTGQGYISDEKFAEHYINRCLHNAKKGPNAILADLYKKGIPKEISRKLVHELYTPEEEQTVMNKLLTALKDKKNKQKIIISLMRRGFRISSIKEFINQIQHG